MIRDDVFATVPVLTGRRLRLEPLGPAVAEPYWRMLQEEEGLRLTGTHVTFTREQIDGWLAGRADHADRADWAAVRLEDGAFLGEVVVFELDGPNESALFRIGLAGPPRSRCTRSAGSGSRAGGGTPCCRTGCGTTP